MHSTLNRAQGVFGFFTTVALFVAALASLSVLLHPADDVTSRVEVKNVQVVKGRPHYYSTKKEEYAQIKFDLDADLSPLFNWNTKQLFVYVLASYPSSSSNPSLPPSESIIWDKIIPAPESPYSPTALKERFFPKKPASSSKTRRPSTPSKNKKEKEEPTKPGVLRLRNQKPKYQITDVTGKMAERENVTLTVGWNVQPWVGALWWSPGTGAAPRTTGQAARSKAFDFPALKGARNEGAKTEAGQEKAKAS